MRGAAWNNVAEAFAVLRVILDRILSAAGPAALAIGGAASLLYFGLAILSGRLWRIDVRGLLAKRN